MFREIRRRLVIVNSAVLLLVLAALGAVLYLHMQYRLYHDMDEILHLSESRIRTVRHLNELLLLGPSRNAAGRENDVFVLECTGRINRSVAGADLLATDRPKF